MPKSRKKPSDTAITSYARDITSANKAPDGFGLGSEYTSYIADFDACIKNGWYRAYSNSLNYPSIGGLGARYGALLVLTRDSTIYHVYYVALYSVMYTIERYSNDGGTTWSEWEFVNPPMELGVEYRTTERYLGKPVYTIAFNFGALPASGDKISYVPVAANISDIIACGGCTSGGEALPFLYPTSNGSVHDIRCAAVKNVYGGIAVSIGVSKDRSNETATVWAKYTKNTE